jgi:hypothetical protein
VSFQVNLDSIQTMTGKSSTDFRQMAADKGFAGVSKPRRLPTG